MKTKEDPTISNLNKKSKIFTGNCVFGHAKKTIVIMVKKIVLSVFNVHGFCYALTLALKPQ